MNGSAKGGGPSKKIIEMIRDVTGASDDDISCMLVECNYDVNETTNRLIDSTWPGLGCRPPSPAGCPDGPRSTVCTSRQPPESLFSSPSRCPAADPFSEVQSKKTKLKKKVRGSHRAPRLHATRLTQLPRPAPSPDCCALGPPP